MILIAISVLSPPGNRPRQQWSRYPPFYQPLFNCKQVLRPHLLALF